MHIANISGLRCHLEFLLATKAVYIFMIYHNFFIPEREYYILYFIPRFFNIALSLQNKKYYNFKYFHY